VISPYVTASMVTCGGGSVGRGNSREYPKRIAVYPTRRKEGAIRFAFDVYRTKKAVYVVNCYHNCSCEKDESKVKSKATHIVVNNKSLCKNRNFVAS
jgi:hypothetical protein